MYGIFFFVTLILQSVNAFSCPRANGSYVNPDDYRSYYLCTNFCPELLSCTPPTIYFTRINQTCIPEPPNWQARYNLTGQFRSSENSNMNIRQEAYTVHLSQESNSALYTSRARYVNETHAIGIQTVYRLESKCTVVFDARIVANGDRDYCFYATLNAFSSRCDLSAAYSGDYCKKY